MEKENMSEHEKIMKHFNEVHKDKHVSHEAMHKAAEELRMEHKGSHDPMYHDKHKNK